MNFAIRALGTDYTVTVNCKNRHHAARVAAAIADCGPYRIEWTERSDGQIYSGDKVAASFKRVK